MRKALLVGISGRIGKALMDALLNDIRYKGITVLTRHEGRMVRNIHLKVVKADFTNLEAHVSDFEGIDDVYCLLGTDFINTTNVTDAPLFDFEYPLNIAKVAKQANVKNFILLNHSKSSLSSNRDKWNKRGKLEQDIKNMQFENLYTFRVNSIAKSVNIKSGLYSLSKSFAPILNLASLGNLDKLKPTPANVLAQKMVSTLVTQSQDKKEFSPQDY